jgi:hypothetical protein
MLISPYFKLKKSEVCQFYYVKMLRMFEIMVSTEKPSYICLHGPRVKCMSLNFDILATRTRCQSNSSHNEEMSNFTSKK